MGGIIHGSLCPHPPIAVPEVGKGQSYRVKGTVRGFREVGKSLAGLDPEVLVVISPHAPLFEDAMAVNQVPVLRGNLGQFGAGDVQFEVKNDLELGKSIMEAATDRGIRVESIDADLLRENRTTDILDHGIMVPLYFLREAGVSCPIVPLSASFLPLEEMYIYGVAIREAIEACGRNAAVLASGDLSHRLLPTAPAGYDPDGKVFDETVRQAVRRADPMMLLELSDELIEKAGQCGLRPLLVLMGAFDGLVVRTVIHYYEGPFGVGYLTAEFLPKGHDASLSILQEVRSRGKGPDHEPSYLVRLAQESLDSYVREGKVIPVPEDVPDEFGQPAGTFVSLKKRGRLRGCIGTIGPTRSTAAEETIMNAISAGTRDPRFTPVTAEELEDLEYSVDVLGAPEPIESPEELDPKRYGVIVRRGSRSGLLLPDIEGVDTVREQIDIAKEKAGISPFEDCQMERFEVIRYK